MKYRLLWLSLVVVLVVANAMILREEYIRANGERILLELAPRDPRSLIQGDYMVLNYAVTNDLRRRGGRGDRVVLTVDSDRIGRWERGYVDGETLATDEIILHYRWTNNGIQLGIEDFFFQEGFANYYAQARYAEVSIDQRGNASLIGLRDGDLNPLDSPN